MKINRTLSVFFIIAIAFIVSACSSDTVVEPPPPAAGDLTIRTYSNLPADTGLTGEFTYFRFSDSSIVTGSEINTPNWDIAFRGTTIWINGGTGRPGNGGAIRYTGSSFDTVSLAPETGYAVDQNDTTLAIPTGSGNGWYSYDFMNNYIAPIPGVVLIIKTGDGKYAKVEILSYYKDQNPQPFPNPTNFRYYTFRFTYQPDGSRKIK
jgi:hypothetical protein